MGRHHAAARAASALLVVCAAACATARTSADQPFESLQAQLAKVQADHDRFDERLGALEAAETRRQADDEARRASSAAPEGDRPMLRVVKVRPDGEVEEGAAAEPAPDAPRPLIRASGRAGSTEVVSADADAKRELEAAAALVKAKRWDKALVALDAFLARFPADPRAEGAMAMRADSLAAKGDWARAAEQYDAVIARFPDGARVADRLLRLGRARARAGDAEGARAAFARLKTEYPTSEAAKLAPRD